MGFTAIASEPLRRTKPRIEGGADPLEGLFLEDEANTAKKIWSCYQTPEVFPGEYRLSRKGNPVFEFKGNGKHRLVAIRWTAKNSNGRPKENIDTKNIILSERRFTSGRRKSGTVYYVINRPLTEKLVSDLLEI